MTCPNQLELGQKLRKSSEADAPAKEGPHSVGVWTLKKEISMSKINVDIFKFYDSSEKIAQMLSQEV